jgi:hypothetical protein
MSTPADDGAVPQLLRDDGATPEPEPEAAAAPEPEPEERQPDHLSLGLKTAVSASETSAAGTATAGGGKDSRGAPARARSFTSPSRYMAGTPNRSRVSQLSNDAARGSDRSTFLTGLGATPRSTRTKTPPPNLSKLAEGSTETDEVSQAADVDASEEGRMGREAISGGEVAEEADVTTKELQIATKAEKKLYELQIKTLALKAEAETVALKAEAQRAQAVKVATSKLNAAKVKLAAAEAEVNALPSSRQITERADVTKGPKQTTHKAEKKLHELQIKTLALKAEAETVALKAEAQRVQAVKVATSKLNAAKVKLTKAETAVNALPSSRRIAEGAKKAEAQRARAVKVATSKLNATVEKLAAAEAEAQRAFKLATSKLNATVDKLAADEAEVNALSSPRQSAKGAKTVALKAEAQRAFKLATSKLNATKVKLAAAEAEMNGVSSPLPLPDWTAASATDKLANTRKAAKSRAEEMQRQAGVQRRRWDVFEELFSKRLCRAPGQVELLRSGMRYSKSKKITTKKQMRKELDLIAKGQVSVDAFTTWWQANNTDQLTFKVFNEWWEAATGAGEPCVGAGSANRIHPEQQCSDEFAVMSLDVIPEEVIMGFEKWNAANFEPSELGNLVELIKWEKTKESKVCSAEKTSGEPSKAEERLRFEKEKAEKRLRKTLEDVQVSTISPLVEDITIDGVDKKLMLLSQKQATTLTSTMGSMTMPFVLNAMDIPVDANLVITIFASTLQGKNSRSKAHISHPDSSILSSHTHSEATAQQLLSSLRRLEDFMESIVLPLAVQRKAIVIVENTDCHMASAFSGACKKYAEARGGKLPFTLISFNCTEWMAATHIKGTTAYELKKKSARWQEKVQQCKPSPDSEELAWHRQGRRDVPAACTHIVTVDGHNHRELRTAFVQKCSDLPSIALATFMGMADAANFVSRGLSVVLLDSRPPPRVGDKYASSFEHMHTDLLELESTLVQAGCTNKFNTSEMAHLCAVLEAVTERDERFKRQWWSEQDERFVRAVEHERNVARFGEHMSIAAKAHMVSNMEKMIDSSEDSFCTRIRSSTCSWPALRRLFVLLLLRICCCKCTSMTSHMKKARKKEVKFLGPVNKPIYKVIEDNERDDRAKLTGQDDNPDDKAVPTKAERASEGLEILEKLTLMRQKVEATWMLRLLEEHEQSLLDIDDKDEEQGIEALDNWLKGLTISLHINNGWHAGCEVQTVQKLVDGNDYHDFNRFWEEPNQPEERPEERATTPPRSRIPAHRDTTPPRARAAKLDEASQAAECMRPKFLKRMCSITADKEGNKRLYAYVPQVDTAKPNARPVKEMKEILQEIVNGWQGQQKAVISATGGAEQTLRYDRHIEMRKMLLSDKLRFGNLNRMKQLDRVMQQITRADRLPEGNSPEATRIMCEAWDTVDLFMFQAKRSKWIAKVSYALLLLLGTAAIVLATISTNRPDILDDTQRQSMVIALSLASAAIASATAYLNPQQRWIELRSMALDLESECWKFRTRSGNYALSAVSSAAAYSEHQAEQSFRDMVSSVREHVAKKTDVSDTAFGSAAELFNRPLSNQYWRSARDKLSVYTHGQYRGCEFGGTFGHAKQVAAENGRTIANSHGEIDDLIYDDHHSPAPPEEYLRLRVEPMVRYFQGHIPRQYYWRTLFETLLVLGSLAGTLMAFLEVDEWVAVVTAGTHMVLAWREFSSTQAKLSRYSNTVGNIQSTMLWWRSLTATDKALQTNIRRLVSECEETFERERGSWASMARQASKQPGSKDPGDDGDAGDAETK